MTYESRWHCDAVSWSKDEKLRRLKGCLDQYHTAQPDLIQHPTCLLKDSSVNNSLLCVVGERGAAASCSISKIQRAWETSKGTLLELLMNYGNYDVTEGAEIKWIISLPKRGEKAEDCAFITDSVSWFCCWGHFASEKIKCHKLWRLFNVCDCSE